MWWWGWLSSCSNSATSIKPQANKQSVMFLGIQGNLAFKFRKQTIGLIIEFLPNSTICHCKPSVMSGHWANYLCWGGRQKVYCNLFFTISKSQQVDCWVCFQCSTWFFLLAVIWRQHCWQLVSFWMVFAIAINQSWCSPSQNLHSHVAMT